jgi:hypothetical protein
MAIATPAAQFGDNATDPTAALKRRIVGQLGGGWEDPNAGTASQSGSSLIGTGTDTNYAYNPAPFLPPNSIPIDAPAPAPQIGPPSIPVDAPNTPAPIPGPVPAIASSPTEGIPPDPAIGSSPTEGVPPPLSAPIGQPALGGSQAPTVAQTLAPNANAVPSTITSNQDAPDNPNQGPPDAPPDFNPDTPTPGAPATPPATNPTGPGTSGPITGPAPGADPFVNNSPVTPPATGAPGTYAPGSPNDPAWKGTDPAQAALNILNNPTSGGVPTAQLVDLINQHYAGAGALYYPPGQHDSSGNEYIGFPGGYLARVPGGQWTYSARGPESAPTSGTPTSGTGTPVAPPQTYTPPSSPTAPPVNTAFQDAIRQQIMDRLKSAGLPVDQNAAGITDAVSAAHDDATRAGEQERTALAERLYAQGGGGLNSGALTQQIQQSGEKVAQTTSGLRANLIMQEYGRKQQELDQLLSMATASGDAESARQIQLYQAQLQAELQREGISADLAKYAAYLNSQTALAGLNG